MSLPTYPAPSPPAGFLWHLDDHDHYHASRKLFPRAERNEYGETPALPMVEVFASEETVQINFVCDPSLREAIGAVSREFGLNRSETIRRLLYAALEALPGEFEPIDDDGVVRGGAPDAKPEPKATPAKPSKEAA